MKAAGKNKFTAALLAAALCLWTALPAMAADGGARVLGVSAPAGLSAELRFAAN